MVIEQITREILTDAPIERIRAILADAGSGRKPVPPPARAGFVAAGPRGAVVVPAGGIVPFRGSQPTGLPRPQQCAPGREQSSDLAAWWRSCGAEVNLRPGGTIALRWTERGTYHTRIATVEPPRRFAFCLAFHPGGEPRAVATGVPRPRDGDTDRAEHLANRRQGWQETFEALADHSRRSVA